MGRFSIRHDNPQKAGMKRIFITPLPRAALRLPGATRISSLRDFGLARCVRELRTLEASDVGTMTRDNRRLQ